jgi:hypothetical protein
VAGEDPDGGFDPDEYRAGIRQARLMGLPVDDAMKPTFYFADPTDLDSADPANRPWDLNTPNTATPVDTPDPVQVVCGIVVDEQQRQYTTIGKFEAEKAVLAMFEDEWAAVHDPTPFVKVTIGGKPYKRGKTLKPGTLFTVTTHRVEVIAEDT